MQMPPKFSAVKIKDKLGVRASETAELIFDNVRVPEENVIGQVGMGFRQAMQVLDGGRISIAASSSVEGCKYIIVFL